MGKKIGKQSVIFENNPFVISSGTVAGKKEGDGPLSKWFDVILQEDMYGEKSWEKAESKMLKTAIEIAIKGAGLSQNDVDIALSGDLINQLMSSSFMARDMSIPFIGIYGACSTMTEGLLVASMLIDGGFANNIVAGASSHYCTAERQFRLPVEHGNQKPPSAQWTATASGAFIVSSIRPDITNAGTISKGQAQAKNTVRITSGTIGKVIDAGIKDANQMGAAMAPAAVDTILNHLVDMGRGIDYYDRILTGDLGKVGKKITIDLLVDAGLEAKNIESVYNDCGTIIYDMEKEKHSGGSGCGCSAATFAGMVYKEMCQGKYKKVLLVSTGAMISTISPFQGESIPGIAHAVSMEVE